MKGLLIVICFFSLPLITVATDGEYAVSRIPVGLLKNAHVVKRMENIRFEINSISSATLRKRYAITVLDEFGSAAAGFEEYYDKLHEIKNIEGVLYDADGNELKRLRNKQVIDLSGMSDNNLADDKRRKFHHFYHKTYPYTVQYEVEIKYNGTLIFPSWFPRESENYAVENSNFSITAPLSYEVRYKGINYTGNIEGVNDKKIKTISWRVGNLNAISREFASPDWSSINTGVIAGPSDFEIENHKGSMKSWKEFGQFVFQLTRDRDQLPASIKEIVHQLTGDIIDPLNKVTRLYEYLQKNTRYVSVQLGIGGWQPYNATYVAANSYGDCKALVNYMYSLLKEANIPSIYTLVRAGEGKIVADFPSQQFNHVILCVPMGKDSIWLECTNQTLPAGWLGDFTSDREALLITADGGLLVRTPVYGLKENFEIKNIRCQIDERGNLSVHADNIYSGIRQEHLHGMVQALSKEKLMDALQEVYELPTYEISSFDYSETRSMIPVFRESLKINVSNYSNMSYKRVFFAPNILSRSQWKPPANEDRRHDIDLGSPFSIMDSVEIRFPAGYSPESAWKTISLNNKFGKFFCDLHVFTDRMIYYRSLKFNGGIFSAADYPAWVNFCEEIYNNDRRSVVLIKK